jgi:hypothetical protein
MNQIIDSNEKDKEIDVQIESIKNLKKQSIFSHSNKYLSMLKQRHKEMDRGVASYRDQYMTCHSITQKQFALMNLHDIIP